MIRRQKRILILLISTPFLIASTLVTWYLNIITIQAYRENQKINQIQFASLIKSQQIIIAELEYISILSDPSIPDSENQSLNTDVYTHLNWFWTMFWGSSRFYNTYYAGLLIKSQQAYLNPLQHPNTFYQEL